MKTGRHHSGKGEDKGEIINQFAIDEHDGYLICNNQGGETKVKIDFYF